MVRIPGYWETPARPPARRKADAQLLQIADDRSVARRKQSIGERTQWNAVVEQSVAAAHHRAARGKRRPCKSRPRRNVAGLSRNGLQELQIVAKSEVQRKAARDFVLILRVKAGIRIGLVDLRHAESLREAGAVVRAAQKIGERRERIAAPIGARKRDGVVVVEKVEADPDGVRALLDGQAVGGFVELIDAGGRRAGQRPKGSHAGNAHGRTDGVRGRRGKIAVGELHAGFIHHAGRQRKTLLAAMV